MKFKIIPSQQTPPASQALIDFDESNKMFEKFLSFARVQHNCVGLAANQTRIVKHPLYSERLSLPFFAMKRMYWWDLIVNPEISEYVGKPEEKTEGCLTWIGKKIVALRYPEIHVEYKNIIGQYKRESLTGIEAQIFQHEYNHLMGIEEKVI